MPGWGWKWGWQGMALGGFDYYGDPSTLSGVVVWYHMDENASRNTVQLDDLTTEALGSEVVSTHGGFETYSGTQDDGSSDTFTGWALSMSGNDVADATATVHGGSNALKMTNVDDGNSCAYRNLTVTSDQLYKLTFYTRGDGSVGGRHRIYDVTGSSYIVSQVGTGVTGTTYTQAVSYFKAPPGCTSVRLYFCAPSAAGSAYFDDISLKPVTTAGNPLTINGSMDSDDLVTGAYGNGQDFDGSDDYLSQYSYEDEEGGSWGATVHGISLADGSAFFNCSGVDLSGFAGVEGTSSAYMLVVKDNDGYPAWGYIGNQDAAEALGSDLFDSGAGTFDSGTYDWTAYGTNGLANDSNTLKITYVDHASGAWVNLNDAADLSSDLTVGKLYKLAFDAKVSEGSVDVKVDNATGDNSLVTVTETDMTGKALYFTATHASNTSLKMSAMGGSEIIWLDNLVLTEVTHVGATGVHIVSGEGSSTRNWFSVDASFNYNDVDGYTFDVYGTDFQLNGDISVGAWVRPADGQPQGGSQAIASKGDPSGVNCETGWNLELSSDGSYLVTLSHDGSTTVTRQSSTTESDGEKESFALVGFSFDSSGQTLNFYYNGSADNGTLTGSVPATLNLVWDPLKVGSNILTQYFDGDIDEVFICSTALSAVDWAALYAGVG